MTSKLEDHTGKDGITTYRIRWWVPGVSKRQSFTDRDRRLVVTMKAQIEAMDHAILASDPRIIDRSLVNGGVPVANVVRTFGVACREMINMSAAKEMVKARYVRNLELHLASIEDTPIDLIDAADLVGLFRMLASTPRVYAGRKIDGLAGHTLSAVWSLVASTFVAEAAAGRIRHDPTPAARRALRSVIERRRRDTDKFLTQEEWVMLEPFFGKDPFLAMFLDVLLGTGTRWSEVAALRVSDLVLTDAPVVRISKALHVAVNGKSLGVTRPKSKSERTIVIDDVLAGKLRKWTKGRASGALVFPNRYGEHLLYTVFYNTRWRPAVKAIRETGFTKPLTIHMLRHTAGSWLLDETGDLMMVSRWLGHSSIKTTADIYMHWMPRGDDRTRAALRTMSKELAAMRRAIQRPQIKAVGDGD